MMVSETTVISSYLAALLTGSLCTLIPTYPPSWYPTLGPATTKGFGSPGIVARITVVPADSMVPTLHPSIPQKRHVRSKATPTAAFSLTVPTWPKTQPTQYSHNESQD